MVYGPQKIQPSLNKVEPADHFGTITSKKVGSKFLVIQLRKAHAFSTPPKNP